MSIVKQDKPTKVDFEHTDFFATTAFFKYLCDELPFMQQKTVKITSAPLPVEEVNPYLIFPQPDENVKVNFVNFLLFRSINIYIQICKILLL